MTNKIVLGLVLGGILGILDGLTSWFTPAVRNQLLGIVFGSTFKGIIAGDSDRRVCPQSKLACSRHCFWPGRGSIPGLDHRTSCSMDITFQIMLPGAMVGLIVGYATQKYGAAPTSQLQRG